MFFTKYTLNKFLSNLTQPLNNLVDNTKTVSSAPAFTNLLSSWYTKVKKATYRDDKPQINLTKNSFFKSKLSIPLSNLDKNHTVQLSKISTWIIELKDYFGEVYNHIANEGFSYLRGLFIIFFCDALITDDEPLWEPLEWSMVQSWILFTFFFAWVGENLIVSRYGSYTGRDKRVWFSWYKTFWLIKLWYLITMAVAILFVMVPFYYEVTYLLPFSVSWWNWYLRTFFFKLFSFQAIVLLIAQLIQLNVRWIGWKSISFLTLIITLYFSYLIYVHFFIAFFSYFTNPNWYGSTRVSDYVQLSQEPGKWGWGGKKRDHFSYHRSTTVFWFKNDTPFGAALFFMHHLFLISLLSTYIYWLTLVRRVYYMMEVSVTYLTYTVSALRQLFLFSLLLYLFLFLSFMIPFWRSPIELNWLETGLSWFQTFKMVVLNYPSFILSIIVS